MWWCLTILSHKYILQYVINAISYELISGNVDTVAIQNSIFTFNKTIVLYLQLLTSQLYKQEHL